MEQISPTKPPPHTIPIKTLAQHLSTYQPNHDPTSITQKIRQITSLTIWAQKYNLDTFNEFFNEKILQKLLNVFARSKQKDLMIIIIESISIMLTNFREGEGLTRLLYDSAMNGFLMFKSSGMTVQVAQYYINLLKTLASRIDEKTLPLIYSKKQPSFALAWQAARFYNHPELLIRTASRTIVLSLMKLKSQMTQRYFSSFPFVIYYSHLMLFLKQYWYRINEIMEQKWQADKIDLMRLPQIIQNHFDILLFIEDLMDHGQPYVDKCIVNAFCTYLLSDIVFCLKSQKKQQFGVNFCLYIIGVLYKGIKNPLLIEIITTVIFGNYSLIKVTTKIQDCRFSYLDSYNKRWSFKNMWDPFDDQLAIYHKYIFDQEERKIDIGSKNKKGIKNIGIVTQTLYLFGIVTNPKFNEQVDKLGKIYGFNILDDRKITKYDSIVEIFEYLRYKLTEAMIDPEQFDENPLKQIFLQFFASKDDYLVMLMLQLFLNLFSNPSVTRQTLSFCRLNVNQKIQQFYTRILVQKLLTSCFHILATYPTLRLCTIFNTIKLILILTKPYENKSQIINQQMRQLLYKALQISVEVMTLKISNYKNIFTLISLYEQATKQINIEANKQFGIGAYGLVGQHQITSLYQKVTFTDKEELEKNIHYHFLLKKFVQKIFPKQISFPKSFHSFEQTSPISSFTQQNSIPCWLVEQNQALQCFLVLQKQCMIIIYPITQNKPPTENQIFLVSNLRKQQFQQQTPRVLSRRQSHWPLKMLKSQMKTKQSEEEVCMIQKQLQICFEKIQVLKNKK